jgi:hypothetical protein
MENSKINFQARPTPKKRPTDRCTDGETGTGSSALESSQVTICPLRGAKGFSKKKVKQMKVVARIGSPVCQ